MFKRKFGTLTMAAFAPNDGGGGGDGTPAPGAGDGSPAPGGGAATPTPADLAAKAAAQQQKPADKAGGDPKPNGEAQDVASLPKWAQDLIATTRKEAADHRTKAKQATDDIVQNIGKALGLVKDENDKPTVEQLTTSLTESQQAAKDATLKLAVHLAATDTANTTALLDSNSFMTSLADVDPADPKAIGAKVTEFVTANPIYSKTPQAGASTADATGSGTGSTVTAEQFAAMSTHERFTLARTDRATFDRLTGQNG